MIFTLFRLWKPGDRFDVDVADVLKQTAHLTADLLFVLHPCH